MHTVYFGPDDLQLIKGSPQGRRRFLDLSLARASSLYYDALLRYNRILAQRNQLLKAQRAADLTPWDEQLATQAVYITHARMQALEEWNRLVGPTSQTWSAGDLNVHLESETTYLKEHVGELPVLLLDDVLSELDEERQQELLRWTADRQLQLIMTAAYRPNRLPEPVDIRCLEKSHGA